ncbi:unnamed protein product, partial [Polarella glacialis]
HPLPNPEARHAEALAAVTAAAAGGRSISSSPIPEALEVSALHRLLQQMPAPSDGKWEMGDATAAGSVLGSRPTGPAAVQRPQKLPSQAAQGRPPLAQSQPYPSPRPGTAPTARPTMTPAAVAAAARPTTTAPITARPAATPRQLTAPTTPTTAARPAAITTPTTAAAATQQYLAVLAARPGTASARGRAAPASDARTQDSSGSGHLRPSTAGPRR